MQETSTEYYSYKLERDYYSKNWPKRALPYQHLDIYLSCWLDPEKTFAGKQVLDIGAGECTYTRVIAEKFRPRRVVACELFLQRMLQVIQENRNSDLTFVNGDAFHLPFRSGSFDVIFGSLVLSQLPDLDQIIREIGRVLSSDGCYVGIEPNPYNLVHLYRYLMGRHSKNQYLFRPKHLIAFEKAGFKVTTQYFYAKLPRVRNRFMSTCTGIVAIKGTG